MGGTHVVGVVRPNAQGGGVGRVGAVDIRSTLTVRDVNGPSLGVRGVGGRVARPLEVRPPRIISPVPV